MTSDKKGFALLLTWAGRNRWYLYASILLALLSSLCSLVPYFAFYQVVDAVAAGRCTFPLALQWAGIILAAAAVQTLCALGSSLSSHRGAYNTLFQVRCMVTEHMAKMPLGALMPAQHGGNQICDERGH